MSHIPSKVFQNMFLYVSAEGLKQNLQIDASEHHYIFEWMISRLRSTTSGSRVLCVGIIFCDLT